VVFGFARRPRDGGHLKERLFPARADTRRCGLIPFLNARDDVVVAVELGGASRRPARRRALELLDHLDLGVRALATPDQLSVASSNASPSHARWPTSRRSSSPTNRPRRSTPERGFAVMGLLRQIAKERNSAVIVVTHDERMIAGFDTVKRLRDGRFVEI
jgi:putative ABC transport system ATP-binding protein